MSKMPKRSSLPQVAPKSGGIASKFRRFREDRKGSIAIIIGLSLTVVVGGSALAVDVGNWYHTKRQTQTAADAAAFAAALDLASQGLSGTADQTAIEQAANDAADRNAFTGTVVVNHPPTQGAALGDNRSVETVLTVTPDLFLAAIFLNDAPQIAARAVARATVSEACLWALHPNQAESFKVAGGAQVELNCGVVVNSTHPTEALYQTGNSCLNATSVAVAGGASGACVNPAAETFTANYSDPMAGKVSAPAEATDPCDFPNKVTVSPGDTATLTPGVYCGGMDLRGTVTFDPGVYVLRGGTMKITSQADVDTNTGPVPGGAFFYLTGSGNNYAQVDIAGGATVDLSAPTSGPYADILFYQDSNAPTNGTNKFNGGSTMDLTGILYFPQQQVEFSGGTQANEVDVAIVAMTLDFLGDSYLSNTYASTLLQEEFYARLVE